MSHKISDTNENEIKKENNFIISLRCVEVYEVQKSDLGSDYYPHFSTDPG